MRAKEFPMLQKKVHGKPFIYLDSAATTQKPQSVIDAITRFYAEEYATVHRAIYDTAAHATEQYNNVRKQVQQFLNAEGSEEIIFTKGTTEAINLVASSFGRAFVRRDDEIIISEMEHHSNIVPWQILCEQTGAHLKIIPIDDSGQLILEAFEKLLTDRTKLVSIAHVTNTTGTINPIKQMAGLAHAKGAKIFVDGAQSASHMMVDVQELDIDFYAFSGHKAYGPTGIGVLYGKRELLEKMPPYQGGGDMIEQVTLAATTYQKPPLRFEAGTPLIAEVMGLGAALTFIESIGRNQIAAWEQSLLEHATKNLLEIPGLKMIGTAPEKGAIVTFVIKGIHPLDIATLLDARGIAVRTGHLCAQPTMRRFGLTSATRLSIGIYNTIEEIDFFVASLKEILKNLGREAEILSEV